jgi:N6-adenosine-specific RNA methylase IME4
MSSPTTYQLLFPLRAEEHAALEADIRARGVQVPIELDEDGTILDGHHRFEIATALGIECPRIIRRGMTEQAKREHVIKLNLARRHLDPLRWAQAFALLLELRGVRRGQGARNDLTSDTMSEVAAEVGADLRMAERRLAQFDQFVELPEALQTAVLTGTISVLEAQRQVVHAARPTVAPPTGKYRVIYADPPWSYGNQGLQQYGHASYHFPTMTITELCALPMATLAEDDAVLFLWVTSPLLAECWPVIEAWGFKYKASFVWDKVKHNFGHYNSVRHEFLLICTRGRCLPDPSVLHDSVQSIERSARHSEKPPDFRAIIETMYPTGARIELFSRASHEGWDAWGNE